MEILTRSIADRAASRQPAGQVKSLTLTKVIKFEHASRSNIRSSKQDLIAGN